MHRALIIQFSITNIEENGWILDEMLEYKQFVKINCQLFWAVFITL